MPAKKKRSFKAFSEGLNLPLLEEEVLRFWKEDQIFEKTLKKSQGKPRFVFYEGPPSANAMPHIGHMETRVFKDIFLRYRTMRGFYVPRKGGWDTHGLPIELQVEKALGFKNKQDIEAYGVKEFNEQCRALVWKYKEEWDHFTERIGFWLDLKDPYITYENKYIESLWWIIKHIYDEKLMTQGYKIVPWCTRCGTGLSAHELAQGYKEVVDTSVYLKFRLTPGQKFGKFTSDDRTFITSWTTTPWTLPGNIALAVGEDISYALVKSGAETWLVADLIAKKPGTPFIGMEVVGKVKGKDLVGLSYEPLFDVAPLKSEKSYKVYAADFVTTTDGTGVVHTAVMYGEDDYKLGKAVGLPEVHTVNEQGRFTDDVPDVAGLYVKAKNTEEKIFEHLKAHGNFVKTEPYTHDYPFCWRCDTPILYYARSAWFVLTSKVHKDIVGNNEKVNWIPEHVKHGRFGEWLKEKKDWNFSRERYWGTPLPIWRCENCNHEEVVGSLQALGEKMGGPKNEYWVIRHGESEAQLLGVNDDGRAQLHLTDKGKLMERRAFIKLKKELKGKPFDMIIASDVLRAEESAAIAKDVFGVKPAIDNRLSDIHVGNLEGKAYERYTELLPKVADRFARAPQGGETLREVRARMWSVLNELEAKHAGKRILIISHQYPLWMLLQAAEGWDEKEAIRQGETGSALFKLSEFRKLDFKPGPRNDKGELDLHRPWIDEMRFPCAKCGGAMNRIKELADVWFDSGSMPFAQWHYPFENKALIDKRQYFPADFITEAIDQTRGWFYTLLTVSSLMHEGNPYKNVLVLGHINDKFGQKMSKSKGNVIAPLDMVNKYGADAVRWYFFSETNPAEPKNFDEMEIAKSFRNFHGILYNSYVFWKTYAKPGSTALRASKHALDKWILARLAETELAIEKNLNEYHARDAAQALGGFVDDLSRWYIRRSRRRLQKPLSAADYACASNTLGYVLLETSKLMAPFMPFFAEALYAAMGGKMESVHIDLWPKAKRASVNKELLKAMAETRELSSLGLAKRAEIGIKVRQPLATLFAKGTYSIKTKKDFLGIVKEEVNVKEVKFVTKQEAPVALDTNVTPELKEEGLIREIVRSVQDLRQEAKCAPKDKIFLSVESPNLLRDIIQKYEALLKKEVNAKAVAYNRDPKASAQIDTKLDNEPLWLGVRVA